MNDISVRTCASCSTEVPFDSVKCPNCGEWREDVKKERDKYYLYSVVAIIPFLVMLYGVSEDWWSVSSGMFSYGFNWVVFFSSFSGWFLLITLLVPLLISFKYYSSVSRKMGKWFWL